MADHRVTSLISSLSPGRSYFSLEFFPPKTQSGFTNLQSRLARMATGLRPLFVTVTWGAGGSTSTKSLELAEVCQRQLGLPTVLHLTCTNMRKKMVDDALEACKELGIRNILALRGDPPREEYREDEQDDNNGEEFIWAIDLVHYVRKNHGDHFCIGVAGYPEGHADESHPEAGKQSVEHDLPYLVQKVKAGADFIMTQLTYDVDAYARYEERLRNFKDKDGNAVFERIPIIPGLMPIQSYQIVKRITKLSHSKLPSSISERIEQVKSDDERVKRVGVDIVSEVVEEIRKLPQPQGLPRGMHFYTLNLEKSVTFILERCDMITTSQELTPGESSDSDAIDDKMPVVNGVDQPSPRFSRRRASSVNAQPHNRVILDSKNPPRPPNAERPPVLAQHEARDRGTGIPASEPTRKHNLMISEGQGALGREATWDDFPNGRWGPSQSASWGEIDGYGPTLKVGPATARKLWGHPKSVEDITNLFRKHLLGEVQALAWSDEVEPDGVTEGSPALRPETATIRDEILALIDRKYWTVASQPSVDGVSNEHPTYGWGPKGEGWVYQKAFCEFFCSKTEWVNTLKPKLMKKAIEDVSWMAVDGERTFESSETVTVGHSKPGPISSKRTPGSSGVNAVTWGVFRGREITVSTLIDSQSFRAWAEEAFELWFAWARCFPKGSDEQKFLRTLRDELMLVSVIGQRYVGEDGQRLWKLLLDN